ncbi:LysR family transcriptional regulator [Endozoicomonadaceae bacterium StTr2]
MLDYLRHMAIFVRIIDAGSVTAAADSLNLSKSAVSQHLKQLEHQLGVALLNRTTRRQMLTPAGRNFYQRCKAMTDLGREAWDEAREAHEIAAGSIRISAPHALVESIIAPAIGRLVSHHNLIEPKLLVSDARVDLIENDIDLAIRVGAMPSSNYRQQLAGHFEEILCASPDYLRRNNITPHTIASLAPDCDYIANHWQGQHITHQGKHRKSGDTLKLLFNATRQANTLPAVIAMACAGAGIAFIPRFLFKPCFDAGKLESVLPEHVFASVPVYAVHTFNNKPTKLVRLAIEAIKEEMDKLDSVTNE